MENDQEKTEKLKEKIEELKIKLSDDNACREFSEKLVSYIKENN